MFFPYLEKKPGLKRQETHFLVCSTDFHLFDHGQMYGAV